MRESDNTNWELAVVRLRETLGDVLQELDKDAAQKVSKDQSALAALDHLNRYLDGIKADMGVW